MEFARAKFEADINEGLMLKMSLGDFKAKSSPGCDSRR